MLLKPFARDNWILDAGWLLENPTDRQKRLLDLRRFFSQACTSTPSWMDIDARRRASRVGPGTRSKRQEIENSRITLYNVQPQGLEWLKAPGTRRVDLVESLDGRQAISFWPRGGATNVIVIIVVVVAMAAVNGHCANLQPLVVVVGIRQKSITGIDTSSLLPITGSSVSLGINLAFPFSGKIGQLVEPNSFF